MTVASATVSAARPPTRANRVLLIEDDMALADMYAMALELKGFLVERARTAEDGLQLAIHAWADVILLDVSLPDRSGLDLLSDFHGYTDSPKTPVVVFSNDDEPATMRRALALGATGFLVKARHTPAAVVQRVQAVCNTARRAAA